MVEAKVNIAMSVPSQWRRPKGHQANSERHSKQIDRLTSIHPRIVWRTSPTNQDCQPWHFRCQKPQIWHYRNCLAPEISILHPGTIWHLSVILSTQTALFWHYSDIFLLSIKLLLKWRVIYSNGKFFIKHFGKSTK